MTIFDFSIARMPLPMGLPMEHVSPIQPIFPQDQIAMQCKFQDAFAASFGGGGENHWESN
jgi:hypothetical protein